ncbi:hypothetical protein L1887_03265 [Cichorium endivia]|nr:hypothetical protein L1887_03265 [Cichorium endivia]
MRCHVNYICLLIYYFNHKSPSILPVLSLFNTSRLSSLRNMRENIESKKPWPCGSFQLSLVQPGLHSNHSLHVEQTKSTFSE